MQSKFNETVAILEKLSEPQIETVYKYAFNIRKNFYPKNTAQILDRLTGILPDENKTLEEYRQERLSERYETFS